ncbi:hypothetical protein FB451DRAFT_1374745 [Mycena latifolia]|nr:hypothetical protein FB451DRAFT_1374745 [Mycena latifolia]
MPLINSSTGVQIHGGTFYEVSGDVNLETHQHLLIQDDTRHDTDLRLPVGSTLTLDENSDAGSHPELSVARNPRHGIGGTPALYALSSRPRLIAKGSSSIEEHPHPVSRSSTSLSREPRLGFRPVPECISGFREPSTWPSIDPGSSESDSQSSHPRDDQHCNLTDLARAPTRPCQNYHTPPSRNTVRSAWEREPQGPHYREDPVGTESRSQDPLAHFPAEPPQAIHGGTFITAQNVNHRHGETGIHILHRAVALEALYDSAESFPQPKCHPQTRTNMLDSLYSWATEETTAYSIYWLSGPAGAGKSAIMQTLCQRLQDARRLGGSFFFKRDHSTRGSAKVLFTTLAYQLALHHPELKGPICNSIEDDPSVVGRGMNTQLHKLIIEPCAMLRNSPTIILLIDGLDECKGHEVQQEVLRLLGSAVSKCPMLRILIASRPEPQISQVFKEPGMASLYHLLDIGPSFMDVRNYLLSEFNRIHHEHDETMAAIPTPWPMHHIVEALVDKSSGYFIYAATIIKFIDDRDFRPTEHLAAVVKNLPTKCGTPFHALDELYLQILRDSPFQSCLLDILCVIVHGSMLQLSAEEIEKLLDLDPGDVKLTLRRLQSLLLVPQDEIEVISLHHKSFRDFLVDPNRSGKFHLGLKQQKDLARSILRALSHSPANKARPSSNHVGWVISYSGLEYITSMIPPSADLFPLIQTINFDFLWPRGGDSYNPLLFSRLQYAHAKEMVHWLKKCSPPLEDLITLWEDYCFIMSCYLTLPKWSGPITAHLPDAACHTILSQSPGLLRILQAWQQEHRKAISPVELYPPKHNNLPRSLPMAIDMQRPSSRIHSPAAGPGWAPQLQQVHVLTYRRTIILWALLIRLSPPCDDLLADIRNLWPSPNMGGFYIHNVLEWLKTFPQPPLDIIDRWQGYLDKRRLNSYSSTYEERWTEFRKQMASWHQREIG